MQIFKRRALSDKRTVVLDGKSIAAANKKINSNFKKKGFDWQTNPDSCRDASNKQCGLLSPD